MAKIRRPAIQQQSNSNPTAIQQQSNYDTKQAVDHRLVDRVASRLRWRQ
jgi:hypothetical protein